MELYSLRMWTHDCDDDILLVTKGITSLVKITWALIEAIRADSVKHIRGSYNTEFIHLCVSPHTGGRGMVMVYSNANRNTFGRGDEYVFRRASLLVKERPNTAVGFFLDEHTLEDGSGDPITAREKQELITMMDAWSKHLNPVFIDKKLDVYDEWLHAIRR